MVIETIQGQLDLDRVSYMINGYMLHFTKWNVCIKMVELIPESDSRLVPSCVINIWSLGLDFAITEDNTLLLESLL